MVPLTLYFVAQPFTNQDIFVTLNETSARGDRYFGPLIVSSLLAHPSNQLSQV